MDETITFELDDYHRNVPESEIIADIRRVASELGKDSISRNEYSRSGKFSYSTLQRRFGSWSAAIASAEMPLVPRKIISDEMLIEDILSVATALGKRSVGSEEYEELGKFSQDTVRRRFGSWPDALAAAKLEPPVPQRISDENLLLNLEEVWRKLGRQPKSPEMYCPLSKFSEKTYKNRFGSWRKALDAFISYINSEESEASYDEIDSSTVEIVPKEKTHRKIKAEPASLSGGTTEAVQRGPRNVNWRLRFIVMRRDSFKCRVCGRSPATDPSIVLHVDHIEAWINGGRTVLENLQTLCSVCNIGKSNLDFESSEVTNVAAN